MGWILSRSHPGGVLSVEEPGNFPGLWVTPSGQVGRKVRIKRHGRRVWGDRNDAQRAARRANP